LNFASSTDKTGQVPHTEENAYYYLRCQDSFCRRKYQWRRAYETPRPADD
jgi:hypothetical protein